jgi:CubicO group peptidase (beta-lactamase class C family)
VASVSARELPAVSAVLEEGLSAGIAGALSAEVRAAGAVVHASCHGTVEDGAPGPAASPAPVVRPLRGDDLFDVASLTKVLCTTTIAAQLVAEGRIALDAPPSLLLPGHADLRRRGDVTVRQLLAHSSGLPAHRPYHEAVARHPTARAAFRPPAERPPPAELRAAFLGGRLLVGSMACAEPLEAPAGTRALYSDVGFIVLGLLLEGIAGVPLAALAEARVLDPLGLRSTFFLDGLEPGAAQAHAAGRTFLPTGACPHRHEVNRGAVNDDNAYAMGGVAGHAGLFSTAREVAAVGQAWLDALSGARSIVPADVAAAFARRDPTPGSDRALGWDTPGQSSSIGDRLGRGPRGAIGHLGYTGTSLWIDLDAGIVCALLTNHTHPSGVSDRERIRAFRRRFHDAVAEGMRI